MKRKIPDKYKYLFENPKPLSECTKEEKAVYAYFYNITRKDMMFRGWWIAPVISGIALLISLVAVAIRIVSIVRPV